MSADLKDFYGQDVASAIKKACDTLGVAQEHLTIEVLETGSKGIFGLIRKKAHIRAAIQTTAGKEPKKSSAAAQERTAKGPNSQPSKKKQPPTPVEPAEKTVQSEETPPQAKISTQAAPDNSDDDEDNGREPVALSTETLATIKAELERLLDLMGCPSSIAVQVEEGIVQCQIEDSFEELLTSQEGRTLDSLQYLLRKIIAKKIAGRIQLTVDVGNYRQRRQQELEDLAIDYAAQVKQDGKTQVITSLNPSERRVVHVALQDDPNIRSRSVGEGLFKKVLIYKPGKGRKPNGRKRGRGKNRKKGSSGSKNSS